LDGLQENDLSDCAAEIYGMDKEVKNGAVRTLDKGSASSIEKPHFGGSRLEGRDVRTSHGAQCVPRVIRITAMKARFQFSLRTLLVATTVVSVLCACLFHEAKTVQQRSIWLQSRPQLMTAYTTRGRRLEILARRNPAADPGFVRRLFGDRAFEFIEVYSEESRVGGDDISLAKALFPEAEVRLLQ
jgi:hypothetical protein